MHSQHATHTETNTTEYVIEHLREQEREQGDNAPQRDENGVQPGVADDDGDRNFDDDEEEEEEEDHSLFPYVPPTTVRILLNSHLSLSTK